MAKSLDQMQLEKAATEENSQEFRSEDVKVALDIVLQMLDKGGLKVIRDAINKSQDPAMVIGQMLAQIFGTVAEQAEKEYAIPPGVFLAKNGVLDHALNYIEKKLGYPEDFSDQIYAQVMETIKAAASSPPAPNNVTGEPAPEQPLPQGGMQ